MTQFGATILDAQGAQLTADERAFFRDANPFGFILFARNIETADQVRGLCVEMRAAVGRDCPILIDQEGGRVQRLRPPLGREWDPPLDFIARAGPDAERAIFLRYRLIAAEMRALGIDTNCAPMVDLAFPDTHAFLRDRCYGSDAATVTRLGRAVADGLMAGGVLPVLKHIPGHGRAIADSHYDLPTVGASLADLAGADFAPFRDLADLPMGMTAHIVYPAIDATAPATLSGPAIRAIRETMGFDGLLMTDDIGMKALSGRPEDIASASLQAGCDVVLYCNASLADRIAVATAAGSMNGAAQARAEAALARRENPDAIDISALAAELDGLLGARQGDMADG